MSLIKCQECGENVSSTCERCPHCGFTFVSGVEKNFSSEKRVTVLKRKKRISHKSAIKRIVPGCIISWPSLIFVFFGTCAGAFVGSWQHAVGLISLVCASADLGLLAGGIIDFRFISKNNSQRNDILYYNNIKR